MDNPSDSSDEEDFMAITSLFLLYKMLKIRRKRKRSQRSDWLNRRWRVRPSPSTLRMQARVDEYQNLFKILLEEKDDVRFFKYTRMTFVQWENLLNLVTPYLRKNHNSCSSPGRDLVITIRYFVTGRQFCDLAMTFGCTGESTIGSIVRRTSLAIIQALKPTQLYERTENDYYDIMKKFWTDRQVPNCCGAMAGKHITVQKLPNPNAGTSHHNDEDRFSLVLLAICDANYRFTSIDIGQYDSVSDGGVFSESPTSDRIKPINEEADLPREPLNFPNSNVAIPAFFVADQAFPLSTRIMRPYPGENLSKSEQIFNYRLSRAGSLIENTFGILTMRWKIFRNPITVKDVEGIVLSILCLHNYLQNANNEVAENQRLYCPKNVVDHEDSNGVMVPGRWRRKAIAFEPIPAGKPKESAANAHMHRLLLKHFFVLDRIVRGRNCTR